MPIIKGPFKIGPGASKEDKDVLKKIVGKSMEKSGLKIDDKQGK